jgi:hypothetical protein
MKVGGRSRIVEKNRNRRVIEKNKERRRVEYSAIRFEVATAFIIIFGMCRRKNVQ